MRTMGSYAENPSALGPCGFRVLDKDGNDVTARSIRQVGGFNRMERATSGAAPRNT
jgi:hypothetical protein